MKKLEVFRNTNPSHAEEEFASNARPASKVFMAYCPQSHPPVAPHIAIPCLKGFIGETLPNVKVTTKSLDSMFYSYLFSVEQLLRIFTPGEADRIREAYLAQRDMAAYHDIPRFIKMHKILESALAKISDWFMRAHNLGRESLVLRGNTFTYTSEYSSRDLEQVCKAVAEENRQKNLFYEFYENVVLPHIIENKYDVAAFSVFLPDQIIPTLLLAEMLKDRCPSTEIILGGNLLTRLRRVLARDDEPNRRLLHAIRAIVVKEGEVPLRQIIERLSVGADMNEINQTIYKDKDGHIRTKFDEHRLVVMNMDRLPRPDFRGIFTSFEGEPTYWVPEPVIPLYTQRGCPCAKGCHFCTITYGNNDPSSNLRRSASLVADDIEFYQKIHNCRVFTFGNEDLTRDYMIKLVDTLKAKGIEAILDGYARTGAFLIGGRPDIEMIRRVSSHFRFIQIGIESTDQATLASMKKGRLSLANRDSELVRALFESGCYPHIFLLIGFPPEKEGFAGKEKDAYLVYYLRSLISTIKWVLENKRNIATLKATTIRIPIDDDKMVLFADGVPVLSQLYEHEIRLRPSKSLDTNFQYEKIHGSSKLDGLCVELFELPRLNPQWSEYTHNTIYFQRLFNLPEGISAPLHHPSEDSPEKERRIIGNIWRILVGRDYYDAKHELAKKRVVSRLKRQMLNKLIEETQHTNLVARRFPDGMHSIGDLLALENEVL